MGPAFFSPGEAIAGLPAIKKSPPLSSRYLTLSCRSTPDTLIRAGNTSTLGPRGGSAPSGRRATIRGSTAAILFPVDFIPLPGARGRHRLQHLLHAGEPGCADRGRSGLPAKRVLGHIVPVSQRCPRRPFREPIRGFTKLSSRYDLDGSSRWISKCLMYNTDRCVRRALYRRFKDDFHFCMRPLLDSELFARFLEFETAWGALVRVASGALWRGALCPLE